MGKMFEALKKAEKERTKLLKKATRDPSVLEGGDGGIDPHLVAYFDRMNPVSEQYRSLKRNLAALHPDSPPRIMVVTSAADGEGKTVTSLNLAMTCVDERENQVVVVDADLRQPSVHRLLGVDNQRGLSDFLAGNVMLEVVLQRTRLPGLYVLPAGRLPGNPLDLVSGKKMDDLLSRLSRDFGTVILDTPAVGNAPDAGAVAVKTDGALMVVRMGGTARDVVRKGLEALKAAGGKVLGTVLTHLPDATYA